MRFKLRMSIDKALYGNLLPLSYTYELSSWIYSVGFLFNFQLKTDPELLHLMYESGAGEKNSLGFGMIEVF